MYPMLVPMGFLLGLSLESYAKKNKNPLTFMIHCVGFFLTFSLCFTATSLLWLNTRRGWDVNLLTYQVSCPNCKRVMDSFTFEPNVITASPVFTVQYQAASS